MDPSHSHQHSRPGQPARVLHFLSGTPSRPSSPARSSRSPARSAPVDYSMDEKRSEKAPFDAPPYAVGQQPRCSPCQCAFPDSALPPRSASLHPAMPSARPTLPSTLLATTSPLAASSWTATTPSYTRPRGLRIANLLKPWIPIILYALTSLGFLAAISFWKVEVFAGLDALSHWLQSDLYLGYAVIFLLVFVTTFPPMPLYSTLIILSGYTFGAWTGAVLSYLASLLGAAIVFVISRAFFRQQISRWLSCTVTIKRVVRVVEKRPQLLFLIRLAPYPYNVMNCLLAASPSLTFRTYIMCTALSLFKLIIHTTIGASIHSFAEYHVKPGTHDDDNNKLGRYSSIAGIALCVGVFIYISVITRRAVNEELEDDDVMADGEERIAFLSGAAASTDDLEAQMVERPTSPRPVTSQ